MARGRARALGVAALEVLRAAAKRRGVDRRQGDDTPAALEHVHAVVKSPGVPAQAPVIAAARERGLPVLGEVEFAWRLIPNEFIAVTGTNGKTTTTELIGHIHREAGRPVAVAGNVGTALSSLVGRLPEAATVVCEVSSFQLEDAVEFAPEGAVLLNLAPDHIDRHGTFEAYTAAKLRVFAHQGNDDVAVAPLGLGVEDLGGCARRVCFGDGPQAELSDRAGQLWWAEEPLLGVEEIAPARAAQPPQRDGGGGDLPGARHRARRGALGPADASPGSSTASRRSRRIDGVLYVNDSKATNVASTLVALESFDTPIRLILGGQGKGEDYTPLRAPVAERCAGVYLIGEEAERLGAVVGGERCETLERALDGRGRRRAARRGGAALARLRLVRPVRRLRGPRAGLQGVGGGATNLASICASPPAPSRSYPSSTTCCSRRRCACSPWAR